jgi:hypothetical protein
MQLKPIYAAILLSAPLWLTGCLSEFPTPSTTRLPVTGAGGGGQLRKIYCHSAHQEGPPPQRRVDNNTRGWKVASGTDYSMTVAAGEMYIGTLTTARQNMIALPGFERDR